MAIPLVRMQTGTIKRSAAMKHTVEELRLTGTFIYYIIIGIQYDINISKYRTCDFSIIKIIS